ncbi:hypothetical protein FXN61_25685 [Lentzea sp. PSKA42]|uniref:Uncharacterized protein n=1 Tax=Lentzea indica TaxID=2604800 RepID=A0ABX1FMN3_9PSEU|nr:hypothetical protein [Lentzea indica]NKE60005.1 hypothetical protein [Lentzea indica]
MRGLAAVLLCLFLAGCAGQQAPPQAPASSSPGTDTSTPIIPAPLPPTLSTTPSRALEPGITVRGTVSAGVEAGCLILDTGTAQYLLLGADTAIAVAGAEVEVTGKAEPGAMTTCQQGTPFHVEKTQRVNG